MNTTEILQGIKDWSANRFARKDGYYETLGAGTATNLAGQVPRTNDSTYRKSGGTEDIATGTARIEGIKGNTVAWNQLLRITSSTSKYGLTITQKKGGKLDIVGTVSGNPQYGQLSISLDIKFIRDGRKYLIWFKNNSYKRIGVQGYSSFETSYFFSQTSGGTWSAPIFIYGTNGDVFNVTNLSVQVFDLTLIYGAGNEPTSVNQFEADYRKWFGKPLTYEPYNKGELIPVKMTGLKTTGFNQYNTESGTAKLIGGNQYQITGTYTSLTLDSETIVPDSNGKFTPTNSGTLTVGGGSTDTCVHLVKSGTKDGTYEPYEEHTLPLNVTTLQGKLNGEGELVTPFADGLKKAGSVQDEIYYVGNKVYGVKRVGSVDLGDCIYVKHDDYANTFFSDSIKSLVKANLDTNVANLICNNYIASARRNVGTIQASGTISVNENKRFFIVDSTYGSSDASTFKTAMSGVMLYYELETPLVYELENVELPAFYQVNEYGTEEQLHAVGVLSAPAILSLLYSVNAVGILRSLPQNFISSASMDNFLAALGSAMGGTWTKTWNENDEEYDFNFTPNASTNSITDNQESI